MTLSIRPAQMFDAGFAAPLIQQTIGHIGWNLTGTTSDEDAAHVIAEFFPLRGHRLSFTNTLIAEQHGRPAGLAVLYPGELAQALDEPYRQTLRARGVVPSIPSEGLPGEYYLDTLATLPEVRGQGIGAALLNACQQRARQNGLPLALLVEEGNPAISLYHRHGFVPSGEMAIGGTRYLRLCTPAPQP